MRELCIREKGNNIYIYKNQPLIDMGDRLGLVE